jgi:asparagine synthase (glutamine-hydrolysing)
VKALLAGGAASRTPNLAGIVGFYLWGAVPEPLTLYEGIHQLPAGSFAFVSDRGLSNPVTYWRVGDEYSTVLNLPMSPSTSQAITRESVCESVRYHLEADVPVGVFLSAGVDSSVLAAVASELNRGPVRTICLAFEEFKGTSSDESGLAAQTAAHYGTDHTTITVSKSEFSRLLPNILECMDQPSIDGINTYLVARAASEAGLKVAISGLGGDELFGGYPSFWQVPLIAGAMALPSRLPLFGRFSKQLLSHIPKNRRSGKYESLLTLGTTLAGAYFLKRGLLMPWELSQVLSSEVIEEGLRHYNPISDIETLSATGVPFGRVATWEQSLYMRNQLLRDSDWAGMAHSLEIRVPLVDRILLSQIAPICQQTFCPLRPKRLLAGVPHRPLPENLLRRPKTGFSVPMGKWTHGGGIGPGWGVEWAKTIISAFISSDIDTLS